MSDINGQVKSDIEEKKPKRVRVKRGKLEAREARMGYFFVLPWIIGTLIFVLIPLGQSYGLKIRSFHSSLSHISGRPLWKFP